MHDAESFRPEYHFTPAANWINDPNGLVYYAGEYHLFYQYHPYSAVWGPMHWGHAVSTDLVHWEELPIALYPDDLGAIFSGSAVIDWHNTAGFGHEAMIAVFTHHVAEGHRQSQSIAYSRDRGRTWVKYAGNPVIPTPPGVRDFRDPKVFWHGSREQGHWVMCLAVGREIQIYTSSDLRDWTYGSSFGVGFGGETGVWETPDLFELPIAGTDATAWVLTVGMGDGAPAGSSGAQYFVGHFDGAVFTSANSPETVLWADYGSDFYAPQSWNDTPDGRRIAIAWMNNWRYARELPTAPWRGAMTVPRVLGLEQTPAGPRLTQTPALDLAEAMGQSLHRHAGVTVAGGSSAAFDVQPGSAWQLDLRLHTAAPQSVDVDVRLCFGTDERVSVHYVGAEATMYLDRRRAGVVDFHEVFPARHAAPLEISNGVLDVQLLIDAASVELFADGGRLSMTDCIFPRAPLTRIEIVAGAQPVTVEQLRAVRLTTGA